MQSAEDFCKLLQTKIFSEMPFAVGVDKDFAVFLLEGRDAEWQARVDRLRAGLCTTTDRIEKLEAALKQILTIPFYAYGDNEAACRMTGIARAALGREV